MRKYETIKKVELNCHLDGSLNIDLASQWSKKSKNELKYILTKSSGIKTLSDYLEKFALPIELLQTKVHLKDAAKVLAETMAQENVIYAEIRIAPLSHTAKGLTIDEVIESVLLGLRLSTLKSKLILTMKREASLEENKLIIDTAKKFLNRGVCAVDLAGDESLFPTSTFKELFEYANSEQVPFTISAGETGIYKDIDVALTFGAKRIGYGVAAIKSFRTMEALKNSHIPLEICLSSNIDTGLYDDIKSHPVARLYDSGVPITINTDNRTLSKTDLAHEYYLLDKYFGFTKEDFNKINRIAIKNAFLSDEEKEKLLKELN